MTGFSADWLALREPFDRAARQASAAAFDLAGLADRSRGGGATLGVLDLACGTGSNLRELAPRLGGAQRWLMVDHDPGLLAVLPGEVAAWARSRGFGCRSVADQLRLDGPGWDADVQLQRIDLSQELGALPWGDFALVTASALLDLVSAAWLDDLLARACAAKSALLFALTVDGRAEWTPEIAGDDWVARCFEAHQRRDKGFGAALGADAVAVAAARLAAWGCGVHRSRSDWRIDGGDGQDALAMLRAMISGSAEAALEQAPAAGAAIGEWQAQRMAAIARTRLRVGHIDLLAVPRR